MTGWCPDFRWDTWERIDLPTCKDAVRERGDELAQRILIYGVKLAQSTTLKHNMTLAMHLQQRYTIIHSPNTLLLPSLLIASSTAQALAQVAAVSPTNTLAAHSYGYTHASHDPP